MSEKITFHTWDEAIEHSENQPKMLVETLLPAGGVALLAGEPGIGKSFFALNLAHSIGLGQPFFGLKVHTGREEETAPVAYVLGEGFHGFGRRVKRLREETDADLSEIGGVLTVERANLADTETQDDLVDELDTLHPRFIVFDTFSSLFHVTSENDNAEVAQLMTFFDYLAQRYEATVLVVHHISKVGKTVRGASAFIGNVDTVISLREGLSDKEEEKRENARGYRTDHIFYASTERAHGGKQKDEREYTHDGFRINPVGLLVNEDLSERMKKRAEAEAHARSVIELTGALDSVGIKINEGKK